MKLHKHSIVGFALVWTVASAWAQGTFRNLNFESANIPNGTQPGSPVPIASALPNWSGSYSNVNGVVPATDVAYEGISLGGAAISIIDTNAALFGFLPLEGRYSPFLFGGASSTGNPTASTISQTGLVPAGTASLLIDIQRGDFTITLGGQTLTMIPLQTFPTYTLYGADITAFAGRTAQLSITAPPTGFPNMLLLDDIVFSQNSIPEPGALALSTLGILLLTLRHQKRYKKNSAV